MRISALHMLAQHPENPTSLSSWVRALGVGISGGHASMRNALILGNSGTFPISIVFVRVSGCKPLLSLFRSLQYINEDLYRSYPSVCLSSSPRQTLKSYSLSYLRVRLPSRFQQKKYSWCTGLIKI